MGSIEENVGTCANVMPSNNYWDVPTVKMNKATIHEEICTSLTKLYVAKNADYGDSFAKIRNELGDLAILVRLSDKIERCKSLLLNKTQKVADEKVEDTLLDLANYAIMELTERRYERLDENARK